MFFVSKNVKIKNIIFAKKIAGNS